MLKLLLLKKICFSSRSKHFWACPHLNNEVRRNYQQSHSCLMALHHNNEDLVAAFCPKVKSPKQEKLIRNSDEEFTVLNPLESEGTKHCPDQFGNIKSYPVSLKQEKIKLNVGCRLETLTYSVSRTGLHFSANVDTKHDDMISFDFDKRMEDLIKPELKQAPLNVSQEFELKDITAPIFQDYKFNLSKEASNWEFWKANFFGFGGE